MVRKRAERKIAFVVPTLNGLAAQDEDIVQLILFAAARLDREITTRTDTPFSATFISVENEISGWEHLTPLFSEKALEHVSIKMLEEPATPNLAIASHKPAYNLFEFLKTQSYDEVHCLDHYGLLFYPTQAKCLGLSFLDTLFCVHVVGGTIFHYEIKDMLLDEVGTLMDDLLERGSLERADVVYIHDRKAWKWYADKIEQRSDVRIYNLAWPESTPAINTLLPTESDAPPPIVYYGPLGAEGGLTLFCDAVDRLHAETKQPIDFHFVGSPQAMGGMDAVSYIRLRTTKWGRPITIKREFSIAEEVAYLNDLQGIIVCNTVRREGLRSRLLVNSGLRIVQVDQTPGSCPANPGQVSRALLEMLSTQTTNHQKLQSDLTRLWRAGRVVPEGLKNIGPPPLAKIPREQEPEVSVCVTHYQRPQKLRIALDSLKKQTYSNFEVIVIDDGSPDPEIQTELESIRREIEQLGWRLLVQENRYLGAARNHGARHARGDYLMFMDDDNVAKPHEIETLVAVAQRTQADIVTSFFDVFETDSTLEDNAPPPLRFTPFGPDPALGVLSNCYGDANALYSKEVFNKLGGFTEDYGITHEDWELFCRASIEGVKMICVPEPLFWYRLDKGGMFRGNRTQVHKNANLRRHIRPYLEKLPYYQAKLVQLTQGLTEELPVTTVGSRSLSAGPKTLRSRQEWLPYARVAVIMRTKDRPVLLRRAIRSVLDQTFKDWLLVIVNDGGSPDVVEFVVDEVTEDLSDRILILHHPISLGMQTASNAGISRCDSDYIIIHDDDDSWKPTFLARTVSYLDECGWNPRTGGVITWSEVIVEELCEDDEVTVHNKFIFNDKLHTVSLIDLAIENCFPPISFLFRRAALDAVGPFDEQPGPLGDWEFHLRVLRQYDIDVIPEPLANYHHRAQSTTGIYGNSVHAQNALHRSKRVELLNNMLRKDLNENNEFTMAQLLTLGDLQKKLLESQEKEFQRLHDYIWTIEQRIRHLASVTCANEKADRKRNPVAQFLTSCGKKADRGRNLARNGDFRFWPGSGKPVTGPDGTYSYTSVCPGVFIIYDKRRGTYRCERRKWETDGQRLPFGKTFLRISNNGHLHSGAWVILEWVIPSAIPLSGRTVCISGLCSLISSNTSIALGGRYELGDGRQLRWPDQYISLPVDFEHWNCVMTCPAVEATELSRGHTSRILLKIMCDQPFEFCLTNFQVELGTTPTEFEYNGDISLRDRLNILWNRTRIIGKQSNPALVARQLS